jgi:hypothetical protein
LEGTISLPFASAEHLYSPKKERLTGSPPNKKYSPKMEIARKR